MTYTLPNLNYSYEALEPHIDSKTMEIHHSKHHQTYVNKLNEGLQNHPELLALEPKELLKKFHEIPDEIKNVVKNHGGGHVNHSLFWELMSPTPSEMSDNLRNTLTNSFGSVENFIDKFKAQALSLFGSGWTWLQLNSDGTLEVKNYANQENPYMYQARPVMGIDVWEHAYYLKNQNRRNEYIESWFHVLDWKKVEERIS